MLGEALRNHHTGYDDVHARLGLNDARLQ